ncbi:MAG: DNA methyltransferase, partial [Candidatus Limnocylindria bacterium]
VLEARRTRRRDATGHPTQKPEALVRLLVALTTPPGGRVLDPFCGSGTTLVAARAIGRAAIGIDRSIRACNLTVRRWEGGGGRNG